MVSAAPTTNVRDIARLMLEERIHAVPLLNAHRRLVGILTTRDLLRGIGTMDCSNSGPS
ncbi:MAG: CBS domain-containing protein [Nitrospira sp.]|nr:CBS domain-containing protein [Nitrospira sp.]